MIKINSQELRDAVMQAFEFDATHGECTDFSDGQFTGGFCHETYKFDGKTRTYYFQGKDLFAYEDVV